MQSKVGCGRASVVTAVLLQQYQIRKTVSRTRSACAFANLCRPHLALELDSGGGGLVQYLFAGVAEAVRKPLQHNQPHKRHLRTETRFRGFRGKRWGMGRPETVNRVNHAHLTALCFEINTARSHVSGRSTARKASDSQLFRAKVQDCEQVIASNKLSSAIAARKERLGQESLGTLTTTHTIDGSTKQGCG